MLGKIIDGKLTYPPHRIVLDGKNVPGEDDGKYFREVTV